jgi:hypothetical protein
MTASCRELLDGPAVAFDDRPGERRIGIEERPGLLRVAISEADVKPTGRRTGR